MGKLAVAIIVALWVIPISIMVNKIVPDPYMDEIFHIPQAQRYCGRDFKTWDPMITTPPGLYYVSLAYLTSLSPGMWFADESQSPPEVCSTLYLRSTNAFLTIICSILVYELIIYLRPSFSERKSTLCAVVMALYPVHWFFTFLYYTDVASVTTVMAMLLASLKKQYWLSATLGAFAILIRQTNVVWMMLVAANGAIRLTEDYYSRDYVKSSNHKTKLDEKDHKSISNAPTLRRRRMDSSRSSLDLSHSDVIAKTYNASSFVGEILDIASKLWRLKWKVLITFAPFLVVMVAFVAFVIWNGSIVLGAKEAHVASPHFAQMMYFALVSAAALAPLHFSLGQSTKLFQLFWSNKICASAIILISVFIGFAAVHLFSIAHPYLLADNRHYTFYIWRRIIQTHWTMKYLLVPLYVHSWISIISLLSKLQKMIWVFLFICATALVLIPAPLIEFRYYTIPFFFLFLHSEIDDNRKLVFIGILYVSVNIFTMMMFLFRPFHWDNEHGTQRFIW